MFILLFTVTAFNYSINYKINDPSIKISELSLKNNNSVLYIQIRVASLNYMDSIHIKTIGGSKENTFRFNKKTKKATLEYFISKNNLQEKKLSIKIFNNGISKKYIQKIKYN